MFDGTRKAMLDEGVELARLRALYDGLLGPSPAEISDEARIDLLERLVAVEKPAEEHGHTAQALWRQAGSNGVPAGLSALAAALRGRCALRGHCSTLKRLPQDATRSA